MRKPIRRKVYMKRFNKYNLAIAICVVVILVSLVLIIKPDLGIIEDKISTIFAKEETDGPKADDVSVVEEELSGDMISEKDARKLAKKQFKEMGEKGVKEKELEVLKIEREGEEYYYISSAENTLEIKLTTGEITRINSVKVEKQ